MSEDLVFKYIAWVHFNKHVPKHVGWQLRAPAICCQLIAVKYADTIATIRQARFKKGPEIS
jgi:hypothetical protein